MRSSTAYSRYTWFLLIMVFLVILAGGVVRMTQSGMGCPDWPRCFGRWIPPTSVTQLPADYETYLRQQDIDHTFNAYHTWIEYINRLLGALLGVFIFVHLVWSVRRFWRADRVIVWWSLGLLVLTGFQGWLGKRVVDANLAVVKITTHMLVALLIAAVPLVILNRINKEKEPVTPSLKWITLLTLAGVLIQIILGTGVREQIDEVSRSLGYQGREFWIGALGTTFYIHRSLSWLVLFACIFLFLKVRRMPSLGPTGTLVLAMPLVAIAAGLAMNFLSVPAIAQPVHLMAASGLSMGLFWLRLKMR